MLRNTKIRNLIFDFGGVIVDLDIQATVDAFARLGVDAHDFIGRTRHGGVFADLELGRISEDRFYDELKAMADELQMEGQASGETNVPASKDTNVQTSGETTSDVAHNLSPDNIRQAWCAMLRAIPRRRLDMLRRLSKRYHIAILSNTNDIHWGYSLSHFFLPQGFNPEAEVIEHVFLSQRLHMCKPNRNIFEEVLSRSGYKAEETLFVDDSAENCKAFAQLGVHTFTPEKPDDWMPKVATIGFFDGVHRGHKCLIQQVAHIATDRGLASMIVTFDNHPRKVLDDTYQPRLLSTLDEKRMLLDATEADTTRILPFTHELSQLTAREFMQEVLRDKLGVEILVMGYDHRFGHGGGTSEDYQRWGDEVGIEVIIADELEGIKASSSRIRHLIEEGDVEGANDLLGHPYMLSGPVVEGRQVGHQLGFPTANIMPETDKLIPARGVYAVWVTLPDGRRLMGMLNIGRRPTINNGMDTTLEVNILDFIGDLYGQTLSIELVKRMRQEKSFDTLDDLRKQLKMDETSVRTLLAR